MRRRFRLALTLLVVAALATLAGAAWLREETRRVMHAPLALDAPRLLRIEPGSNVTSIARRLEAEGWLPDYRFFVLSARLDDRAQRIQAGTYELAPGDSLHDFLAALVAGRTKTFAIRFIEGCRFSEMRALLAAEPYLQHSLDGLSDAALLARLGLEARSPEGLFFPATYHFDDGTRDVDILARAARRMQDILGQAWAQRREGLPYASPYEALIMASIIEKETGRADERARIGGVFVRRLERGMKLQTDPTVIYGLGDGFDGNLRRADLRRDTPYNTYVRHGLPPTPIAMPGADAFAAALDPAPGNALYFVAKGDGAHHFSASLGEHNAAVRRYQLGQ
ncbi:MAG: endolytic transglycosylase MltG [Gammaproteobacteria bacterium]